MDRPSAAAISLQYWFGPLFYALALALAVVSVPASLLLQLGLAVFSPCRSDSGAPQRRRPAAGVQPSPGFGRGAERA